MGEKPLEIKINLNFELWFGETNNDQDWGSFRPEINPYVMQKWPLESEWGYLG